MDIKWIEDFLALVEHGSFTKAAEGRNVTQPGFSRRIRSLEYWLGVDLVNRNVFPTTLTKAGEDSIEGMRNSLNCLYELRAQVQESSAHEKMLILSTQHSLSISFFPKWYQKIKPVTTNKGIRLHASNLHDCIIMFLAGQSDFLLCYYSQDMYPELERLDINGLEIDSEYLLPICSAQSEIATKDLNELAGIDMVGFPADSFFGRLIAKECIPKAFPNLSFDLACETAFSDSIKAMVLQGMGMSWLPASLVEEDLARGDLVQLKSLPIHEMKIMLYRQKTARTPEIDVLWKYLAAGD
jgi:DNA-binding transcriptional LysR family regulator